MDVKDIQGVSVPNPITATIANSGTTSNAIKLYGSTAAIIETPGTITGTTLTFLGSVDFGVTFKAIKDIAGNLITYTVAADGSYPLDPNLFVAYDQIQLVLATQSQETVISVKPYSFRG